MKKIIKNNFKLIILFLILLLLPIKVFAMDFDLKSKSAILVNRTNNEILYENNIDEKLPIASLTKIMTTIVSLENIKDLNETITIDSNDIENLSGYVIIGLTNNINITYNDLLYSTMMYSAADSANVLANHVFNNYDEFINKMNSLAIKLNMTDTHFSNPIGMDKDNYSTVKDMYNLLDYALKNNNFYDIYTKKKYNISSLNKNISNNINNIVKKNNLENNGVYFTGSKAGYTSLSGLSLSTITKLDDNELLLITLDALGEQDSCYNLIDQLTILNYYKTDYSNRTILKYNKLVDNITYKKGDKEINYEIRVNKTLKHYLPNDMNLEYLKVYYEGLTNIDSSIKNNEKLGTIYVYNNNILLGSTEVLFNKLNLINEKKSYRNIIIIIIICFMGLLIFRKKK